jgi:hypothetical protein
VNLRKYQLEIETMLLRSTSFDEIEQYIDDASLAEDEKAALWLFSWVHEDPLTQRRVAEETLALVGAR